MSTRARPGGRVLLGTPSGSVSRPRIASVRARVVRRRYHVPFSISSGRSTHLTSIVVTLGVDRGPLGVGETSPMTAYSGETTAGLLEALEEWLAPSVIGHDVFDVAGLHGVMDQALRGGHLAKAAVDIAVMDLQGKLLGVDVATLLGGRLRDRIDLAWVVGLGDIDTVVREAVARASQGFSHLKVKGGVSPRRDADLVAALVAALPSGTSVALDANEGYELADALPSLRRMDAAGLAILEQPLPRWDLEGMSRLTTMLDASVMADESLQSIHDAATLARRRGCDSFNLKVLKVGGLHRARQITALAEAEGIPVKVGSMPELGVATLAAAHLAASTPMAIVPADLIGPMMVERDLLATPPIDFEHCPGSLVVPTGPGLGADLAADAVGGPDE